MSCFEEVVQIFENANFIELSDVFIIPKKLVVGKNVEFFNYYSKSILKNKVEYYLRSNELDFCITPYSRYKLKSGAYFSLGNGLIGKNEGEVFLAEKYSKNIQEVLDTKELLQREFENISGYIFLSKIQEEFALQWLKISVIKTL